MIFAEGTLVLEVQLCSALCVQSSKHLDQNVFQDSRPLDDTQAECVGTFKNPTIYITHSAYRTLIRLILSQH